MVQTLPLSELRARWAGRRLRLLCRVSFEERSLAVTEAVGAEAFESVMAFASLKRGEFAEHNYRAFCARFPNFTPRELDTAQPLAVAQTLFEAIESVAAATGLQDTVIDVTSFRREEILMIVAILRLVAV